MSSAVVSLGSSWSGNPPAPRPPVPPSAVSLMAQARRGLADAERQTEPVERFTSSYAAAQRAAAGVLAARGRPHRGRSRPTSVWTLLSSSVPELAEWAAFFAAHSKLHAAAQAGITHRVDRRLADDLVRQAGQFVDLAHRVAAGSR